MSSESAEYAAESRVPQILLGTIIPSAIATIFVFARLYSRAFITRSLGADDAWISISWVAGLTVTILNCLFTNYGSGHHQIFQTTQDAAVSAKMSYVARVFYQFVLCTTKLGICSFYLRVFQDRRSKLLIYSLMGFVVLFSVPLEIYVLVQCRPGQVRAGSPLVCDANSPDIYMSAIFNIVADALLLSFIVPRIVPLKMAARQKAALLAVVCLGGLVMVAAVVRLTQVLQFNLSTDRTWDFANITTWSAVEVDTGLFCASAPAIKPLIRKLTPGIFSSTDDSHNEPSRNQRRSDYGTGTQRSRIHGMDDAFELSSQTDLNAGKNLARVTNKVWRGDEESKGTHWDDSTSEDAVFEPGHGKIMKTVSVTVTNVRDHSKVSMERENSVVRFEPI